VGVVEPACITLRVEGTFFCISMATWSSLVFSIVMLAGSENYHGSGREIYVTLSSLEFYSCFTTSGLFSS
jgi:hypothetical protein